MEFKDRLKYLREERGLSAAQLAAQFDKSESAIRMWELGRSKPDADTLVRLAIYFECTVDYILGLSNNKNETTAKEQEQRLTAADKYLDSMSEEDREKYMQVFLGMLKCYNSLNAHTEVQKEHAFNIIYINEMFNRIVDYAYVLPLVAAGINSTASPSIKDTYEVVVKDAHIITAKLCKHLTDSVNAAISNIQSLLPPVSGLHLEDVEELEKLFDQTIKRLSNDHSVKKALQESSNDTPTD